MRWIGLVCCILMVWIGSVYGGQDYYNSLGVDRDADTSKLNSILNVSRQGVWDWFSEDFCSCVVYFRCLSGCFCG